MSPVILAVALQASSFGGGAEAVLSSVRDCIAVTAPGVVDTAKLNEMGWKQDALGKTSALLLKRDDRAPIMVSDDFCVVVVKANDTLGLDQISAALTNELQTSPAPLSRGETGFFLTVPSKQYVIVLGQIGRASPPLIQIRIGAMSIGK